MPNLSRSCLKMCTNSALRSSAFEGMQPTFRQTPPQYCFSTTATFRPSCAARMAATYPPVPAPITTTSYSLATIHHCGSAFELSQGHESFLRLGRGRRLGIDLRLELPMVEFQLPVHLGDLGQLP